MKAAEIKVSGIYWANVSGKKVKVRVDAVEQRPKFKTGNQKFMARTYYTVTNLSTGRTLVFRSAKRFLVAVPDEDDNCGEDTTDFLVASAAAALTDADIQEVSHLEKPPDRKTFKRTGKRPQNKESKQ